MTDTRDAPAAHRPPIAARRTAAPARGTSARPGSGLALVLALLTALLVAAGCTRLEIAYGTAPFLVERWADGYLDLDSAQLAGWEPRLKAALENHRNNELPLLAGFVETLHRGSSTSGFDSTQAHCLTVSLQDLYERHARIAVDALAPLLAGLSAAQVRAMEKEFDAQTAKDRARPSYPEFERARRARRYAKSIEEWTGPLSASQRALVGEVTARMPLTARAALDYRTGRFAALIALLRTHPGEAVIARFLTDWLVEFRNLPPTLAAAIPKARAGIEELLIRFGPTLDQTQRRHLNERLAGLKDDLMRLQRHPRLTPLSCPA